MIYKCERDWEKRERESLIDDIATVSPILFAIILIEPKGGVSLLKEEIADTFSLLRAGRVTKNKNKRKASRGVILRSIDTIYREFDSYSAFHQLSHLDLLYTLIRLVVFSVPWHTFARMIFYNSIIKRVAIVDNESETMNPILQCNIGSG